jgi:hypothetical protein
LPFYNPVLVYVSILVDTVGDKVVTADVTVPVVIDTVVLVVATSTSCAGGVTLV